MTDEPELELEATELVRPYVITNGRELPGDNTFTMITLVAVSDEAPRARVLDPEKLRVMELCAGGFLAVAEIAAHTGLPMGVVKILLSDLVEDGYLLARAPVPRAQLVERELLEEVLHGLRARFG
ncbi:DUF742 domain-containing protein [Actinacidiphila alni]|uniref:DUF742 domain-containing protein n=1 Tax=Actinacidiphila alni TaxID=380248 RepID=A0A1I2IP75_9ACTN|nr:DUF742 domain-containing protein [Actinacidiphila alni]SFF43510.1 Protein of unknown function [Actinacidiphila alni]